MSPEDLEQLLAPRAPGRAVWCAFDADWYAAVHPQVRDAGITGFDAARDHYVREGRGLGLSPNMFFDETWYLRRHPDAAAAVRSGQAGSGYEHYYTTGYLSLSPHWLYDEATYVALSPDVSDAVLFETECVNLYDHYLRYGAREGRVAHLLFSPQAYADAIAGDPDALVAMLSSSAHEHYLLRMWSAQGGMAGGMTGEPVASAYFDPAWFMDRYPDARAEISAGRFCAALHAYLARPGSAERDPNPQFSERFYLERHADARAALAAGEVASGFEHFLKIGVFDLRAPAPDVDLRAYAESRPELPGLIAQGQLRDVFEALRLSPPAPPVPVAAPPPPEPPPPAPTPAPPPPPPAAPPTAPEPVPEPVPAPVAVREGRGHVEFYGYHTASHGWMFCGWITRPVA